MTAAEYLTLLRSRVRYLTGKTQEAQSAKDLTLSRARDLERRSGVRPDPWSVAGTAASAVSSRGRAWRAFDNMTGREVSPVMSRMFSAAQAYVELGYQAQGIQGATDAQRTEAATLSREGTVSLTHARALYEWWRDYPASSYDPRTTSLGERVMRGLLPGTPAGQLLRALGVTSGDVYDWATDASIPGRPLSQGESTPAMPPNFTPGGPAASGSEEFDWTVLVWPAVAVALGGAAYFVWKSRRSQ